MGSFVVVFYYDGILRGKAGDAVYLGDERRVILVALMLRLIISRVR